MSFAVLVSGCGSGDPDTHGFPWQVRPTPGPVPVPLPTPDGDPTTDPDPNDPPSLANIDLLAAALADQGLILRGVYDTDRAAAIEEGVHYTERAVFEETSFNEVSPGVYESFKVNTGTLRPDGSIEVIREISEAVEEGNPWGGTNVEIEQWRAGLDGERKPADSIQVGAEYQDELVLGVCPNHVLTLADGDALEPRRLSFWPLDSQARKVHHHFRGLVGDSGVVLGGGTLTVGCDTETALLLGEGAFRSTPDSGNEESFYAGRPAVIELTTAADPYALEGGNLVASRESGVLAAAVRSESGEVREFNPVSGDEPLLWLPGTDHFEWLHLEANENSVVVILREAVPTQPVLRSRAFVVHVDLERGEASIYMRTVSGPDYEVDIYVNLTDDLMAITYLDAMLTSASLLFDVKTNTVVQVGREYGLFGEVSGDFIAFRASVDGADGRDERGVVQMQYVVGTWIRQ